MIHVPLDGRFFDSQVSSRRATDEEFHSRRELVLAQWPTGTEVANLDAAISFAATRPKSKNLPLRVREAKAQNLPLFQVGIGHTTPIEQEEHMVRAVEEGVDLILVLTDTYTRKSLYPNAQAAVDRALASDDRPRLLNGFPIVNYGVHGAREVFEKVDVPIHISGNVDEAAMLTSEIAFAAGCTCDFTHTLHDLVQHSRDYPIERRIQTDQYISRLAGHYTQAGVPIEMLTLANYQGLIPPSLGITVGLLAMLRSAAQGVKYFSLHRCIEGCLTQDVAAFDVYRRLGEEYAAKFGFDVDIVTHSWPWMGAWPPDESENAALVAWCTSIAMLAGVDWIYLKSVHEGSGIPNVDSNVASIHIARELRRIVPPQAVLSSDGVRDEIEMIELEVRSLLDAALACGDGDPCRGEVEAVRRGFLDIPISSWKGVQDGVVAARDKQGAVRFLKTGNLPLPREAIAFHRQKMDGRRESTNFQNEIELVIADVRSYMTDARDTDLVG